MGVGIKQNALGPGDLPNHHGLRPSPDCWTWPRRIAATCPAQWSTFTPKTRPQTYAAMLLGLTGTAWRRGFADTLWTPGDGANGGRRAAVGRTRRKMGTNAPVGLWWARVTATPARRRVDVRLEGALARDMALVSGEVRSRARVGGVDAARAALRGSSALRLRVRRDLAFSGPSSWSGRAGYAVVFHWRQDHAGLRGATSRAPIRRRWQARGGVAIRGQPTR
jgi:hypothetical protein